METVEERLGDTAKRIGGLTARVIPNTQLLELSVEGENPAEVQLGVNTIGEVFIAQQQEDQSGESTASRQVLRQQITDVGNGEVRHFVDWLQYVVEAEPVEVYARALPNFGKYSTDNVAITISYANGSVGSILYYANGDKRLGKEHAEVAGGGRMAVLDDFRTLTLSRGGRTRSQKRWFGLAKGHAQEMQAFANAARGGESAIPFHEMVATSEITLAVMQSLKSEAPVTLSMPSLAGRLEK